MPGGSLAARTQLGVDGPDELAHFLSDLLFLHGICRSSAAM
jgi:hypothetical protein